MPEPRGVFDRVKRDRQVSNLLYGLLGYEDERDPQTAIRELATSARKTLEGSGPDYLERVAGAAHLLIEMCLDVARAEATAAAAARLSAALTSAEREHAVRLLGSPHGPVRAAVERAVDEVLDPELERRVPITGIVQGPPFPALDGPFCGRCGGPLVDGCCRNGSVPDA